MHFGSPLAAAFFALGDLIFFRMSSPIRIFQLNAEVLLREDKFDKKICLSALVKTNKWPLYITSTKTNIFPSLHFSGTIPQNLFTEPFFDRDETLVFGTYATKTHSYVNFSMHLDLPKTLACLKLYGDNLNITIEQNTCIPIIECNTSYSIVTTQNKMTMLSVIGNNNKVDIKSVQQMIIYGNNNSGLVESGTNEKGLTIYNTGFYNRITHPYIQ